MTTTGTITAEYDLSKLTQQVSTMTAYLMGAGANEGECRQMLKSEAAQLAWDISEALGPRTLEKGKTGVEKDARRVFFPMSPDVPMFGGSRSGTQGDMRWLFAYKKNGASFLVGAEPEDVLSSPGDLRDVFYGANRQRGAAWLDLGEFTHESKDSSGRMRPHYKAFRGRQHAMKLNRIVVSSAAYQRLVKVVQAHIGDLRATFARAAVDLGIKKRIPAWILKRVGAVTENGKSIFNDSGLNDPTDPWIEFGSRAKGVTSNPHIVEKIQHVIAARSKTMAKKLKDIASGAKYVFETGQVYFPKVDE